MTKILSLIDYRCHTTTLSGDPPPPAAARDPTSPAPSAYSAPRQIHCRSVSPIPRPQRQCPYAPSRQTPTALHRNPTPAPRPPRARRRDRDRCPYPRTRRRSPATRPVAAAASAPCLELLHPPRQPRECSDPAPWRPCDQSASARVRRRGRDRPPYRRSRRWREWPPRPHRTRHLPPVSTRRSPPICLVSLSAPLRATQQAVRRRWRFRPLRLPRVQPPARPGTPSH